MWPRGMIELARGAIHLLYPGRCLICDQSISDADVGLPSLCTACRAEIATDRWPVCSRCAATVGPHTERDEGCVACREAGFRFEAAIRLGPYEGRLREAILRMKRTHGDGVAEVMGTLYAEIRAREFNALSVEVVVPVPLFWRHRVIRGHNQAESTAREIAVKLGLKCQSRWLRRIRGAVQHTQPSAADRRENVKGAFKVAPRARFSGRCVLLVDDVMTTGSTLSEVAGVIKKAGARRVVAAVLARR